MAQITMARALNEALRDAMEADDRVVLLGEDVGTLGGVFRITDGLLKDFGEQRVMDTPLAESAIMGVSVGLALRGEQRRLAVLMRERARRERGAETAGDVVAERERREEIAAACIVAFAEREGHGGG